MCIRDSLISDQDFENGLHTQECYELTYMASGRGTCFTRGKYYDVHQGDVFILRTGDLHNIKSDNEAPLRFFYCGFDFDEADPRMSVFRPLQELLNTTEMPLASDKFNMYTIFTNIFNEYMSRNAMRETVLETLLIELLCALYRDFVEVTKDVYKRQFQESVGRFSSFRRVSEAPLAEARDSDRFWAELAPMP